MLLEYCAPRALRADEGFPITCNGTQFVHSNNDILSESSSDCLDLFRELQLKRELKTDVNGARYTCGEVKRF